MIIFSNIEFILYLRKWYINKVWEIETTVLSVQQNFAKKILESLIFEGETEIQVDLSNLSSGMYVYKISKGKEVLFLKTQKL